MGLAKTFLTKKSNEIPASGLSLKRLVEESVTAELSRQKGLNTEYPF